MLLNLLVTLLDLLVTLIDLLVTLLDLLVTLLDLQSNHCSTSLILKGFHGAIRDISFAHHEERNLVAAVDEYGNVLVHEIFETETVRILKVGTFSATRLGEIHRVVWCPHFPLKKKGKSTVLKEKMSRFHFVHLFIC